MNSDFHPRYDLPTAVTFFLAGLGAGSLLALIFSPREVFPHHLSTRPSAQSERQLPAL